MSAPTENSLDQRDIDAIRDRGLNPAEIQRQRELLAGKVSYRQLDRPAMVGDGIRRLSEAEASACLDDFAAAASVGRYLSFVPASGAASRMFKTLVEANSSGRSLDRASLTESSHPQDHDVLTTFTEINRLAIGEALEKALSAATPPLSRRLEQGDYGPLLQKLLDPTGLSLPQQPKGLLPFHRYPDTTRTAFEEHLREAAALLVDQHGQVRAHFTVSPQHQAGFDETLGRVAPGIEADLAIQFQVGFSTQSTATDTIALDQDGHLFRDTDGSLLFRPGGHGSLIRNLEELRGDFVFIKNIDNIVPDVHRDGVLRWRRILGGLLARLQRESDLWLTRLSESGSQAALREPAEQFVRDELGLPIDRPVDLILSDVLDRPMRVCGVVANTGDPGGGPFWVRGSDGSLSRQIVETAEIDPNDPAQTRHLDVATHFNPTDMVCALRNRDRQPLPLSRFVNRSAVFVAQKSSQGRDLRALEHPGLWNGSMAEWTTIFVEVPRETFQPVKSLLDLLGPGHAPS